MLIGMVGFTAVVLFIKSGNGEINTHGLSFPFSIVVPVLAAIAIIVSKLMYSRLCKSAFTKVKLSDKMQVYYSANIIRLALVEGAALFSIVVVFISGEIYFLLFTLLLFLIFYTFKPSRERAISDLKLNPEEATQIKNDEFIILTP